MDNFCVIFGQDLTYFKDILNNLDKNLNSSKSYAFVVNFRPILRTLQWYKALFPRGEIPGYRHTQRAENTPRYTSSERREKRRKIWVQARPSYINNTSGTLIYIPYGERERIQDTQDIRWAGKAQSDQWGRQRQRPSPRQAETLTWWAETLTH